MLAWSSSSRHHCCQLRGLKMVHVSRYKMCRYVNSISVKPNVMLSNQTLSLCGIVSKTTRSSSSQKACDWALCAVVDTIVYGVIDL